MSEDLSFEDELANLLSEGGDDFEGLADFTVANSAAKQPAKPPEPPVQEKPKERTLSQAEIDALLASMLNQE